jgi:2-polyprenyl-3-methyl-5-hydroxy-6-metoxy-1,4-benzoquinol methylase
VRKQYETIWHGIPFESFATLSVSRLPDPSFYARFYEILHQKYRDVDDLDASWLNLKRQVAGLITNNPKIKKGDRILSVGCGLGIIEMALLQEGFLNIEITEVSEAPLRWVRPLFPLKNVHVGFFPDCILHNEKFDVVFLASVEYFLEKEELFNLLRAVHDKLLPGGTCLLVSWSFDIMSFSSHLILRAKDFLRPLLYKEAGRRYGQFIGYFRRPAEFRRAIRSAGFKQVRDGMLDTKTNWNTYWIEATKNSIKLEDIYNEK